MQAVYDYAWMALIFFCVMFIVSCFDMFFAEMIKGINVGSEPIYLKPFGSLLKGLTFFFDKIHLHHFASEIGVVCLVTIPTLILVVKAIPRKYPIFSEVDMTQLLSHEH